MSAPTDIQCWRCGSAIPGELFPLRREEVCPECDADLHVCRLCTWFNPSVSDGCDEPIAGGVTNKERANFCDYFKPKAAAYRGAGNAVDDQARAELDALFGGATGAGADGARDDERSELERLFGLNEKDSD